MIRRLVFFGLIVLFGIGCLLLGMHSGRSGDRLFRIVRGAGYLIVPPPEHNEFGQLTYYPGKREIPRPAITSRTMVAFTFGQSNAANHGSEKFRATTDAVANFWNGKYYRADDPLLGASGVEGSVWTRMADRLVQAKRFDSVILIAAGISATPARAWSDGGPLNGMLEQRLIEARNAGLTVTHFLWHQGEQDNTTASPAADYDAAMQSIIALTKRYFPQSKFFVARATLCGLSSPANATLQKTQSDLARLPGVYAGPNTDEIVGLADRSDGCHMNGRGLDKHADGWVAALAAQRD